MKVLFRADGSKEIGMGHLTRCADIAKELNGRHIETTFLTRSDPPAMKFLRKTGNKVMRIPNRLTIRQEINHAQTSLRRSHIDCVVADLLLDQGAQRINRLKTPCNKLITLTDDTKARRIRQITSDILFAFSPSLTDKDLRGSKSKVYYVGPGYFPLKPSFGEQTIRIRNKVRNILVTLGGSDPTNNTVFVLETLERMALPGVRVNVIAGPASGILNILQKKKYTCKVTIMHDVDDMLPIMMKTDIAICSAGNTLLELIAVGAPTIVLPHTRRENENAAVYERKGCILKTRSFGNRVARSDLTTLTQKLISDKPSRVRLNNNCRGIIEGKGLNRLIELIEGS